VIGLHPEDVISIVLSERTEGLMDFTVDVAQKVLAELADPTVNERFRIIKDGEAVAAIVHISDLDVLEHLDELEDEMDAAELDRIRAEEGPETWVSLEDVRKQLGIEA
jgi:hypothetical protein